ncbi:MAG: PorT family protein [Krumholzibacteria bacterium]|nr:PorT family protein [Candidatus Krumholzibacteria bacterium]
MLTHGNGMRCAWVLAAVAALALAGAGEAAAQGRFGFFGGLNFANMGGDMDDVGDELAADLEAELGGDWTAEKGSKTGLGVGAYYFVPRSSTLGFQIEAQYIRRGVKFDIASGGNEAEVSLKLDYFEIPLLLRLSPGAESDARLVFLLGPVIGFKAGADMEVEADGESMSADLGDEFKSMTFGAIGGVGLTVATGENSAFLLQARYYLGLSNALDDDEFSSKSGDFGFFAGLEFGLGD